MSPSDTTPPPPPPPPLHGSRGHAIPQSRTKIVIASSGLGHVARGIEAWANDLARALVARGLDTTLCKGGGIAHAPHEHVLDCWQRTSDKTRKLLDWLPR